MAAAIMGGNCSGVQAKTAQPSAANAAALSWSYEGAPSSDRASSTIRRTPAATIEAARLISSLPSPPS
jgi:hypothetical protein